MGASVQPPAAGGPHQPSRRRRVAAHPGAHAPSLPPAPRSATLPSENPDRHRPGVNENAPPRPLGVAPGQPWQPRDPLRDHGKVSLQVRLIEFLDEYPWIQRIGARLLGAATRLFVRDMGALPPDAAPEPGSWKFAAVGDYGAGTPEQARVSANMIKARPELVVTVGDNVYPSGRWTDYAKNWDPEHLTGGLARSVPFMPTLGNHDMYRDDLRPYFGHFQHLKGRTYYGYEHKNAHFMALDSDQDLRPGSAQYKWLEEQLKNSNKQWKIVYLHYPLYGTKLTPYTEIRDAVQPLLQKYGVQLLLAGHEHNYMRSVPINGVQHILTGGGGQQVWQFSSSKPAHIARRQAKFHHVEVSVGLQQLVLRAIDEHGERIDTVVVPYNAVTQARQGAQATLPATPRPR